ncbi:CpsD/CapB family tyrosine-protein kinase [Rhodosalinus sp. K401]|uniref:CpsD/CapB family tyrosine-protein kinase n=1 Tax=Rhodosalinus sp. K401 TaxID=3239195 RepID=UPI00352376D3
MERLQAAIEKARRERDAGDPARQTPAAASVAAAPPPPRDDAAWDALARISFDRRVLRRNRVVTFDGGPEAGPYDMLRTKLLQRAKEHGWRRIAITSPDSHSGKTTTAANLAFSLARRRDMRTLVLDLDLRRRALGRMLGQRVVHTMADVLEGRVRFEEHGCRYEENLAFGLNGAAVRNPAEVLQSRRTAEVLDEIDAALSPDIVLVDLPPMMATDDSFGFLRNVDCALILAGAEKTGLDLIDVAERQVAELTNVMGIVLNKSRYTDGAYGYEQGYY